MRISDWSSDVCSSDLGHDRGRTSDSGGVDRPAPIRRRARGIRRARCTPAPRTRTHYPRNDHETACWACLCLDVATLLPASAKAAYIVAMTAPATGPVATELTARLTHALTPPRPEVIIDSAGLRGPHGDDGSGESHFTLIVEPPIL